MDIVDVIKALAVLSGLMVAGMLFFTVVQASRGRSAKAAGIGVLALLVLTVLLTTLGYGLVFIQPQERGVVISALSPKGYRDQALDSGLHWIVPFVERVQTYPLSNQTYTMSIAAQEGQVQGDDSVSARTSDGQEIFVDASVIYAIQPDQVVFVHLYWQDRYTDDLVRPQARGLIRDVVSQFGVEEVVSTCLPTCRSCTCHRASRT